MLEDFADFFERNAQPVDAWKAALTAHANRAIAHAETLFAHLPGDCDMLHTSTRELHTAVHSSAMDQAASRERTSALAAYMNVVASCLLENVIAPCDARPHTAASGLAKAALAMLRALNGDYGDRPQWSVDSFIHQHTPALKQS